MSPRIRSVMSFPASDDGNVQTIKSSFMMSVDDRSKQILADYMMLHPGFNVQTAIRAIVHEHAVRDPLTAAQITEVERVYLETHSYAFGHLAAFFRDLRQTIEQCKTVGAPLPPLP